MQTHVGDLMRVLKVTLLMALFGLPIVCQNLYFLSRYPGTGEPAPLQRILGSETGEGFAKAIAPRKFSFPADHGPHAEYQSEWWYFTGNLHDESGRRFGYQLTLFRFALTPDKPDRLSAWATKDVYMGHFALTDIEAGRFYSVEHFSRGAMGLAGAELKQGRLRLWLDNWQVNSTADQDRCAGCLSARLDAADNGFSLKLELRSVKPVALQGDGGLSHKGDEPGNASYYYSLPRLAGEGEVIIGDNRYQVAGLSWMDREWSTSSLSARQKGWDWFSLHLDDGRDVMFYQFRRDDGSIDAHSAGSVSDSDGRLMPLDLNQVRLDVLKTWRSPVTGVEYPAAWRLSILPLKREFIIQPLLNNQELNHSIRYWEGAVEVLSADGHKQGSGYAELVGY